MDPLEEQSSKSILQIAGELGVRSNSVQKALRELGVNVDDPSSPVDPDLEDVLIDHLIDQGTVPSKFKRKTKDSDEPFMSDDLLLEAMGAGEDGFSEERIPRQMRVESGFAEKPSWFERFFGKKKENEVVRSLRESERTSDDLDRMFAPIEKRSQSAGLSPLAAPEQDDFFGQEDEYEEVEEPSIELSDDILDEFDDLDMDGIEDIADLELEGFEELSKEAEEAQEEEPAAEEETEETQEEETESEGEEEGEEGEVEEADEEDEDEIPVGMFERVLSRIHLTPAEMWTVTGGSLAIMLVLLGITIYWYMFKSPSATEDLWTRAEAKYEDAEGFEDVTTAQRIQYYGEASDLLLRFIDEFPEHDNVELAFRYLCDSHYEKAYLHKTQDDQEDLMIEEFKNSISYFNQFLNYLESEADDVSLKLSLLPNINDIEDPDEKKLQRDLMARLINQTFPDPVLQEEAMRHKGHAHWELGEYPEAVEAFKEYLNKYSGHDNAPPIRLHIGDIYQEWAAKNKENEFDLLDEATFAYEDAIAALPDNQHLAKMNLYKGLGEIEEKIYLRLRIDGREESMQDPLDEAIAYLQKSYDEAQLVGENLLPEDQIKVYKFLSDLNLTRGEMAVEKLEEWERVKEDFREGEYLQVMEQGVSDKREEANLYLQNSLALYEELLKLETLLEDPDKFDILYNKANAQRLIRDYDEALATAEELNEELGEIKPSTSQEPDPYKDIRVKNAYLLGHIAWDKAGYDWKQDIINNRRRSLNSSQYYTNVKKYYQEALAEDGFYPEEENGIVSHLADIRLTNVLYIQEQEYEQAIERFKTMVGLWPEDDYSYLTYYFYGKTLELYGDEKRNELQQVNDEIKQFGITPELYKKRNDLQTEMANLYQDAIIQYGKAIEVRPSSQYVDINNEQYLVEMNFHRGFSAFKQGKYINDPSKIDAENLLTNALQKYRNHPVAREKYVAPAIERLGDLYRTIGLYDTAIDKYREYIDNAYEDEQSKVRMKLADTYLTSLSYDEARMWYQRIIDENPPPSKADIDRARRMGKTVERGPAYEALKKKAQTYLDQATIAVTEATAPVNNRHKYLEQALDAYQKFAHAYPIDPENNNQYQPGDPRIPVDSETQRVIGNIYFELEDYPNAAKNLLAYLNQFPNAPHRGQIYNKIGQSYIQAGMIDEAINRLYLVNQQDITNPSQFADVKLNLAQAYELKADEFLDQGNSIQYELRLQDAIKAYTEVIKTGVTDKATYAQEKQKSLLQILRNRQDQQANPGG